MSNPAHGSQLPTPRNRTCRDVGHAWQTTTSDFYRVCTRPGCHAVQRRVQGGWLNAQHRHTWLDTVEAQARSVSLPQQQALFSGGKG